MISMIQSIILSYIKKYSTVNIESIKKVANEPSSFIAREVVDLYKRKYITKQENEFHLSNIGEQEKLVPWNMFIINDDEIGGFSAEKFPPRNTDKNGMPVFINIEELYQSIHMDNRKYAYHIFYISKGKKKRIILAPARELKERQRWILRYILKNVELPECVHGFVNNKSIVTNAYCHVNKQEIGCIDIKDFFPSITKKMVVEVFKNLGYSEKISKALAEICTYEGILPQGAPTSPMIANLVLKSLDLELLTYANKNKLVYTRYADDITISGDINIEKHIEYISKKLNEYGFCVNEEKNHIMKDNYRKIVTGLVVTNIVKVPKKYKRKFRQEIYYCKKYGIEQHLKNSGRKSAVNYKEYMYGKAYYIKMVEKEVGEEYLRQLDEIFSAYS